uniref:Uncharacterized protein n=1 Tax=Candidatus Kentrum sp. MB TaxID=2138164 RepID=A0A450XV04_9GAMM|nr:MAG: hypothetical protein BECKMB1821G_GA0114241_103818 [Candidatus Kentron sp. MB]VFK33109.1 MAG: hypothetical protein BECKMB1821I_GA0114274_104016 [Candidatus Kentron sp. MB]VFK76062.1 MAG: hypothetical protein BECKMB1821H_GA0114242_104016 [Candidatus Kentron sp. MB]
MGGWGCPNEVDGICLRVEGRECDPGMKGCVLFGRFVFSNTSKNRPGGPRENKQRSKEHESERSATTPKLK